MEQLAAGRAVFSTLIDLGGPVMAVLAGLSLIAVTLILAKLYQFLRLRAILPADPTPAISLYLGGRREEALNTLAGSRSALAPVLRAAMGGNGQIEEAARREETERVALAGLEELRAYLRGLELIATLAPLLGLLGTVLGMIEAFQELQGGGSRANPALLAGGIWEALLTTAAGLTLAIPASAAFLWFERLVERSRHAMEDAATRVFTGRRAGSPAEGDL
ncbi:MAG: MotA/TolQ/ExbB proton channel family protein [Rhodovibrionaceae bacterium]